MGWGARAPWSAPDAFTASAFVGRELARLGVRDAFGVLGGGIAAFADGLRRAPIRLRHTRHEAGAVFAAIEAHFATDRPTAVVVTTGPGLWNALNGAMAARADGAKLVLVSGATSRAQLGRGAVQETGPATTPAGLTTAGPLFHLAAQPETVAELRHFLQQLAGGWAQPGGFVAHLALPWSLQTERIDPATPAIGAWTIEAAAAPTSALDATLARLDEGTAALWIGHGARGASAELRAFAEAAQLPVICSPRAKGVFDEDHPLFVGVSGAGGHATVPRFFAEHRPATLLVLGSRLGEVTSFLAPGATPSRGWIHVDLDPGAFAAAFPGTDGMGVVAEVRGFVAALDARARATGWYARRTPAIVPHVGRAPRLAPRAAEVRHPYLMQVVQELIVEGSDAVVMSEAGNAFTWCNFALRFAAPGRYRTSAAWGSMGHFTTGCVGAALAGARRAVAIVGDGAMLMNNEINTAVAYRADVIWIVLNDAQLGLNEHGMSALGMRPVETQLPRTDFAAFARCQGAVGIAVATELELAAAIAHALATPGPVVIDVRVDRTVPSPILALRIQSLQAGR
ncbi:MAG: thiamine pyrophosphate-binding protein [Deltaproteobacteria bacterium]|nr:thiamine pyrophosphate-binding protein [Deltaproteobacteria bacterium]